MANPKQDPAPPGRGPRAATPPPSPIPGDGRRRCLIDAAEELFFSGGYHRTTMDDVAKRAGMSKKTVYQVFGSKAALFEGLLFDRLGTLQDAPTDTGEPLEASLIAVLTRQARFILSRDQVALIRLIIAERDQSPELVRALRRYHMTKGPRTLEQWLALQSQLGRLQVADPAKLSALLFGLAFGELLIVQLLGIRPRPTAAQLNERLSEAARLFLQSQPMPDQPG
jgi:AcrR family transcriptional regulator